MSVEHFVEKLSTLLDLKVVASVQSSLIDCASQIAFFRFAFSAADKNVQSENIVDCELMIFDSLLKSLFVDDDLVAVNQMFFELMRKNSLKRAHLVVFAYLLNDSSHLLIDVAWLDESQSSLGSLISSQNGVCLLSSDRSSLIRSDHNGVSD